MNVLQTWQFNLVGFLITNVIFYQYYKHAVKKATHDGAATILLQLIAGVSILALTPFFTIKAPSSTQIYVILFIAMIFYASVDRILTSVRKHLEVSVYSMLNQLTTVFLVAIGILIFKEQFIAGKLIGTGLILLGNMLLFLKGKKLELNKYAWLAVLASLLFAVAISIDVGISRQFNLPVYVAVTLLGPALMITGAERIEPRKVLNEFKPKVRPFYLITGISWSIMIVFSLRAYQLGEVITIAPLSATSVLLNVLVAFTFFGERKDKFKKILASGLVILGVYLTTIS